LYTTTTNGTLFTDKSMSFLQESGFSVVVSLDGPSFVHDKHRKFIDGRGSFDVVMKGVEHIKSHFPDLYKKLTFNAVINPDSDYKCVSDFFEAETILKDSILRSSPVSDVGSKDSMGFDDNYFITYRNEYMKVLLYALGFISLKNVSKLFVREFSNFSNFRIKMDICSDIPEISHHGGPCLPGVMRLFVDVNGYFYPCERVSETSESMRIGHIDTGFDISKAEKLLNIGELTVNECLECWNLRHCSICAVFADKDGTLDRDAKLAYCKRVKNDVESKMRTLCLFREMGIQPTEVTFYEESSTIPI